MSPEGLPKINEEVVSNLARYEDVAKTLAERISNLETPLAHGTTSEHLEDVLRKGLGSETPENAFDGERISLTDLQKPGGLLGAYSFARMNPDTLAFQGEEDSIARYVKEVDSISEDRLREQFERYKEKRGNVKGYPVLFVFEGGDIEFVHNNPRVPSEVELVSPLKEKTPRIMLVPESKIDEVRILLGENLIDVEVLPIESLEVV